MARAVNMPTASSDHQHAVAARRRDEARSGELGTLTADQPRYGANMGTEAADDRRGSFTPCPTQQGKAVDNARHRH